MSLQRRLSRQAIVAHKNANDITNDLLSLSFENVLSTEERQYLPLRARYHAFSVTSCAHATYITSLLNEMRQVLSEIRNPINKKTMKFLNQTPPRNPLKVGLIGCGRLGKQIISSLLAFADIRTDEIIISTRRPGSLTPFQKAGIECVFDNREVVASANIVFLCCLPANMPSVAEDIAGYISADCLLFSFVTGIAMPRLKQMLQHNNIAKMEFTWSMKNGTKPWNIGDDVTTSLEKSWIAELTCPLSSKSKENAIVWSSPKTIETAVYAALNMCPSLGVTTEEAIHLVNIVFLDRNQSDLIKWNDILDKDSLSYVALGNLPVFDIFHIATLDTPLTHILQSQDHEELQKMILKKYLSIFNRFRNTNDA